jgi:hypothetical protein
MKPLQLALEHKGYEVFNINYPSTQMSIAELSEHALSEALDACHHHDCRSINFITHSMGGILVRYFQRYHGIETLHRVVMLGPPNQGSEVVDSLRNIPAFKWLNGPAGGELGTGQQDTPSALGPVNFELGVIAGTKSISPLLSSLLPAPHDGKVSVAVSEGKVKIIPKETSKETITRPDEKEFAQQPPESNKVVVASKTRTIKEAEDEIIRPGQQIVVDEYKNDFKAQILSEFYLFLIELRQPRLSNL